MVISAISSSVLKSYEYPHGGWVLVRVQTDEGIEGIGECFVPHQSGRGVFSAKSIIDDCLAAVVIGEGILNTSKLWEQMYEVCRRLYDTKGLAIHALSGLDMAILDAAAKTLRMPLHVLLGGSHRERIRVYVSSVWVDPTDPKPMLEATTQYVVEKYTAIKYYGWEGFGSDRVRDTEILRAIRTAAGPKVDIMLDLGRPSSLTEAIQTARMIESSGADIAWWEEPLSSSDDLDNLARLTDKTDITIAAGESELTAFRFHELLQKRAVDLLQPDLSWVGGLTEGRRIAELARSYNIPLVPHNWGTMLNFAASIHLVASMPQGYLCEYPITPRTWGDSVAQPPSPMMTELTRSPVKVRNGYAEVPTGFGLGVELDEDAVARFTV